MEIVWSCEVDEYIQENKVVGLIRNDWWLLPFVILKEWILVKTITFCIKVIWGNLLC